MNEGRQRGFSLLEVAIALLIVGLLASAGLGALQPAAQRVDALAAERFQQIVRQALVNFAQTQHRLPCPDTDMNGYEDDCAGTAVRTGGVPYHTLGVTLGTAIANTDRGAENMLYGVYRNAALDADLAQLTERTGDAPGDAGYRDGADLREALMNAAHKQAETGLVATELHVTGDGLTSGAEDCATNRVANMAFTLISAGSRDMNDDGNAFDGINAGWERAGGGSWCSASPARRKDRVYDDTVISLSFDELLGDLE